jgi:hypothetical protein
MIGVAEVRHTFSLGIAAARVSRKSETVLGRNGNQKPRYHILPRDLGLGDSKIRARKPRQIH